jgi:hypothetical protein
MDNLKLESLINSAYEQIIQKSKCDLTVKFNAKTPSTAGKNANVPRTLTLEEKAWYQKLIEAMKNPKQAFTELDTAVMPVSIINDVLRNLQEQYPILETVNMQYTAYLTRWIKSNWTKTKAVWGEITSAIEKEITSGFEVVDIPQAKLSAFSVIEKGLLNLGPEFLDMYIRACLIEALSYGLEDGIVNGSGINAPVGLVRDIHKGVEINPTTGYPEKTPVTVKDFSAASYGSLLASLMTDENGNTKKVSKLCLAVNSFTYLTKVMPAIKIMTADGMYADYLNSVFPTDIIMCSSVPDNRGVLYVFKEYDLFLGGRNQRDNTIDYSDDYGFLEDLRYYKIKLYGNGRAYDNTTSLYLDLSNVAPAALKIKNVEGSTINVSGNITVPGSEVQA